MDEVFLWQKIIDFHPIIFRSCQDEKFSIIFSLSYGFLWNGYYLHVSANIMTVEQEKCEFEILNKYYLDSWKHDECL